MQFKFKSDCTAWPPHAGVVVRTYSYEGEGLCDRRMAVFRKSIEAAGLAEGQGFAAIKVGEGSWVEGGSGLRDGRGRGKGGGVLSPWQGGKGGRAEEGAV